MTSNEPMQILVAGATGALGRRLVPRLVGAGHTVTAMTRSQRADTLARELGAMPVRADALDPDSVAQAVAQAEPDAIVHQLTALSGKPDLRRFDRFFAQTNRLRTEGTDHLLAAGRAAGVRHFVAQSYAGWPYARSGGWVKREEDPLDPEPVPAMRNTHAAIRHVEEAVTAAGGAALRYGAFYGPGTNMAPDGPAAAEVRRGRFPVVGDGRGMWSFIHIDDAAAATVAALERRATGIYNIVDDDPAPVAEWLPEYARALGARPPRRVPRPLARVLAGQAVVVMMTEVRGASNAKAKAELGWTPAHPSWRGRLGAAG